MQKLTLDNMLYQLITNMNLDFVSRELKSHTTFSATNYTVIAHKNKQGEYHMFVGCNKHMTRNISLSTFDISAFNKHYQDGIEAQIEELESKISNLKDVFNEQGHSRIPKDISHIIGYDYQTLKVVGGNELIYVDKAYSDRVFILCDIAKRLPLLERYIKENEIVSSTKIKLLTPDTFKKEYPIKPYKE